MSFHAFSLLPFPGREQPRPPQNAPEPAQHAESHLRRAIGPVGTVARLSVGLLLIGLIVYGQLVVTKHFTPAAWALGLLGIPVLVLAWHWGRIRCHHVPFRETGLSSFLVSLVLPLAVYVTGWMVPSLGFLSDATLLFLGFSLLLATLRGSAGCEFLALSNWLLRRHDQIACAVFTPIDLWERQRTQR